MARRWLVGSLLGGALFATGAWSVPAQVTEAIFTVFCAEECEIRRADLDGANEQLLTAGVAGQGLAVDAVHGKVAFSRCGLPGCGIHRCSLDGSDVELVVPTAALEIAVDPWGGKVYWMFGGKVSVIANLDGSQSETIALAQGNASGLAVDPARGYVYWAETHEVRRAGLDGSGVETVIGEADVQPPFWPQDVAVHPAGAVYVSEVAPFDLPNRIMRFDLDGSNAQTILDDADLPGFAPFALSLAEHEIYFVALTVQGLGGVWRVDADGSDPVPLISYDGPIGTHYLNIAQLPGITSIPAISAWGLLALVAVLAVVSAKRLSSA